jgi:hypothetical protein
MRKLSWIWLVCALVMLPAVERAAESADVKPSARLEEGLKTVLSNVDLRDASLRDVVEFLVEKGKINIVIADADASERFVTLRLMDVPLKDVLRYVAEVADLDLRIDEHAVVLSRKESKGKGAYRNIATDVRVSRAENNAYLVKTTIKEGGEILSAPQMLTQPGKEGTIEVVSQNSEGKPSGITMTVLVTETNQRPEEVVTAIKVLKDGAAVWQSRQSTVVGPLTITADELEYDASNRTVQATGNVRIETAKEEKPKASN